MMERIEIFLDLQCHIRGIASRKAARKATGANSGCIAGESENQRLRLLTESSHIYGPEERRNKEDQRLKLNLVSWILTINLTTPQPCCTNYSATYASS